MSVVPKLYHTSIWSLIDWAKSEMEHVERIADTKDPDIQHEYALSTVYGMLHLKNAITEVVNNKKYKCIINDLKSVQTQINTALQNLVTTYNIKRVTIENFNTRKILLNLNSINWTKKGKKAVPAPIAGPATPGPATPGPATPAPAPVPNAVKKTVKAKRVSNVSTAPNAIIVAKPKTLRNASTSYNVPVKALAVSKKWGRNNNNDE